MVMNPEEELAAELEVLPLVWAANPSAAIDGALLAAEFVRLTQGDFK